MCKETGRCSPSLALSLPLASEVPVSPASSPNSATGTLDVSAQSSCIKQEISGGCLGLYYKILANYNKGHFQVEVQNY